MALGDETIRYTPNAVNGSEALDLDHLVYYGYDGNAVQEPEYEEPSERDEPTEITTEREARHPGIHEAERRTGVSLLTVFGIILAVFVSVLTLLANVRLTALSTETVALGRQLETLQQENSVLKIRYENTFDMEEIESYAVNTLGMTRLADSQIIVLGNCGGDHAEIIGTGEREAVGSVLQEAGAILPAIRDYLQR